MPYKLHPACTAWPPMTEEALAELTEDIRINGLREPITLTPDGLLLDGRNRAIACEHLGIRPTTVVWDGDPVAFSISKNARRRHLDKIDLGFAGAKLTRLQHGSNRFQKKVEPSYEGSIGVIEKWRVSRNLP